MSAAESVIVPELLRSETDTGLPGIASLDDRRARLPTGTSVLIRDVISLIRQVAGHDSTVLVLGESGTGKEVCARGIHDLSPRPHRPLVAPTCWNPSCSAMSAARSPALSPPARAGSRSPKAAPCSSTKSAT